MGEWTIYHNNRCSKSRDCLALLYDNNIVPTVVDYLRTPPSLETLQRLVKKLGVRPRDILREKEPILETFALDLEDDHAVLEAMVKHPILIERPIIEFRDHAVVGRPPEKLRELLKRV